MFESINRMPISFSRSKFLDGAGIRFVAVVLGDTGDIKQFCEQRTLII
jgi:hypothetical protein